MAKQYWIALYVINTPPTYHPFSHRPGSSPKVRIWGRHAASRRTQVGGLTHSLVSSSLYCCCSSGRPPAESLHAAYKSNSCDVLPFSQRTSVKSSTSLDPGLSFRGHIREITCVNYCNFILKRIRYYPVSHPPVCAAVSAGEPLWILLAPTCCVSRLI